MFFLAAFCQATCGSNRKPVRAADTLVSEAGTTARSAKIKLRWDAERPVRLRNGSLAGARAMLAAQNSLPPRELIQVTALGPVGCRRKIRGRCYLGPDTGSPGRHEQADRQTGTPLRAGRRRPGRDAAARWRVTGQVTG
jgi:hypothetical protein